MLKRGNRANVNVPVVLPAAETRLAADRRSSNLLAGRARRRNARYPGSRRATESLRQREAFLAPDSLAVSLARGSTRTTVVRSNSRRSITSQTAAGKLAACPASRSACVPAVLTHQTRPERPG